MRRALLLSLLAGAGCQSPPRCVTVHANIVTVTPVVSTSYWNLKVEK